MPENNLRSGLVELENFEDDRIYLGVYASSRSMAKTRAERWVQMNVHQRLRRSLAVSGVNTERSRIRYTVTYTRAE